MRTTSVQLAATKNNNFGSIVLNCSRVPSCVEIVVISGVGERERVYLFCHTWNTVLGNRHGNFQTWTSIVKETQTLYKTTQTYTFDVLRDEHATFLQLYIIQVLKLSTYGCFFSFFLR